MGVANTNFPICGNGKTRLRHTLVGFFLSRTHGSKCARVVPPAIMGTTSNCKAKRLPSGRKRVCRYRMSSLCLVPATRIPMAGVCHSIVLSRGRLPVGGYTCARYFHQRTNSCNGSMHKLGHLRRFSGMRLIHVSGPRRSHRSRRRVLSRMRNLLRGLRLPCHVLHLYNNSVDFATTLYFSFRMCSRTRGH